MSLTTLFDLPQEAKSRRVQTAPQPSRFCDSLEAANISAQIAKFYATALGQGVTTIVCASQEAFDYAFCEALMAANRVKVTRQEVIGQSVTESFYVALWAEKKLYLAK